MTTTAAARAAGATKIFGSGEASVVALQRVSVSFDPGGFTAIMGPSGSGKSTLMHCLAGLDALDEGQVFIGDTDLGALTDTQLTQLRRDRIGFVFQSFNLLPTLNAWENITLPFKLGGRAPNRAYVEHVIDILGISDRLMHLPAELSGGQQQRIAVARALATSPEIVFADEPTGNLDTHTSGELLDFLCQVVSEVGQTVVMVTHDPKAAASADAVLFLTDGRIVDQVAGPTADEVLDRLKVLGT